VGASVPVTAATVAPPFVGDAFIMVNRRTEIVVPVCDPVTGMLSLNMEAVGAPHGRVKPRSFDSWNLHPLGVPYSVEYGQGPLSEGEQDVLLDRNLLWLTKHRAPLEVLETYLHCRQPDVVYKKTQRPDRPFCRADPAHKRDEAAGGRAYYPLEVRVLEPDVMYERIILQDNAVEESAPNGSKTHPYATATYSVSQSHKFPKTIHIDQLAAPAALGGTSDDVV